MALARGSAPISWTRGIWPYLTVGSGSLPADRGLRRGKAYRRYFPNPTFLIFFNCGRVLLTALVRSFAFDL